jgi:hypothetical protein
MRNFCDIRLTKVIADPNQSSHRDNLHMLRAVGGSFTVSRITGLALAIGFWIKW